MTATLRITLQSLFLTCIACDGGEPDDSANGSSGVSSVASGDETGDVPTTDANDDTSGDEGETGDDDSATTTEDSTSTPADDCPLPPADAEPPTSVQVVEDLSWDDGVSGFEGLPAWDGTYPTCAVSSTCEGNTAPVLAAPLLFLNGAYVDLANPIVAGDRVGIVFPFADAECNLVGGFIATYAEGPEIYSGGSNDINEMACVSGPGLGFDLGRPDPGVTTYSLDLTDQCGASVHHDGEIVVSP